MKYKILFLGFALVASMPAVMTHVVTPQSYVLSLGGDVLPADAKVVAISLHVDQAEGVRVRSLPPGWIASAATPAETKKFGVSIELLNWGNDRGVPLDLTELNGRFWIVAIEGNDGPVLPRAEVTVYYILSPVDAKAGAEIKSVKVSPSSIRLTYIP